MTSEVKKKIIYFQDPWSIFIEIIFILFTLDWINIGSKLLCKIPQCSYQLSCIEYKTRMFTVSFTNNTEIH